jgi:hypothetical protein
MNQHLARRNDPNADQSRMNEGLAVFIENPSDAFLVDQLVFLELVAAEK